MAATRIRFVEAAAEAPEPSPGMLVVVLDPAWTPTPGSRADLVSARRLFGDVVARIDPVDEALTLVDAWADATGVADRLMVEDVTYWFRLRESMWRWLHERLLWRYALATLDIADSPIEVTAPPDEAALIDIVRGTWPTASITAHSPVEPAASVIDPTIHASRPTVSTRLRRAIPWRRQVPTTRTPEAEERARREAVLADRVRDLVSATGPRVLVLTNPATHQRVAAAGGDRTDPLFGAVIPKLRDAGLQPVLIGTGLDQRRDEDWSLIAADDRLLPLFLLRTRWSEPGDEERAAAAVTTIVAAIARLDTARIDLDGADLTEPFLATLSDAAGKIVRADLQLLARIERLLAEIRPVAIVLAQEGIRTPWLVAGDRAGVPVFAVQHGVLYAGHAGYPNRRLTSLPLPTRTFVYGDYERRVLLDLGAYLPEQVEVTGSPRLDLDVAPQLADDVAAERNSVRGELGVANGDRLLVVSTINLRFVQRSHLASMIERVLGAHLPRVHVVFKQHPGEHDEGPYRTLLEGLASAGGYKAPPITVIKDIDLYRLLRASDAHLGLFSTVLTDAVAAGAPNLLADVDRHADLLGYIAAGVARPVRDPIELLAALSDPRPPEPAARQAFLDDHFQAGDASGRIARAVASATGFTAEMAG
jgi:hypothetical protein